jgi:hypothetical protein
MEVGMSNLGMGVMIGILGGNEETVDAIKAALGKTISSISMGGNNSPRADTDALNITFTDDTTLQLWDGGQSCCESRYMTCEDNLPYFVGATLTDVGISEAASPPEDEYGECHEIQFLDVTTSKGLIQVATHNEHNGYYGGFWIQAKLV